jgi:hypothetical protein
LTAEDEEEEDLWEWWEVMAVEGGGVGETTFLNMACLQEPGRCCCCCAVLGVLDFGWGFEPIFWKLKNGN